MLPFICKADGEGNITSYSVLVDGKMYAYEPSMPFFTKVLEAIQASADDLVRKLVNVKQVIAEFSNGKFQLFENALYFQGKEVSNSLSSRIIALYRKGSNVLPMVAFLENLLQNPSQSAINELYGFMEACTLPITDDGHFLAYKMIRNDYMDKYTGTMDNSVGQTVIMTRSCVDDNREQTCSSGLHFCSLEYVEKGGYGTGGTAGDDRLVILKINPRDVVSIPVDYNNSKGRACEYLVWKEIDWTERLTDWYENTSTALSDNSEWTSEDEIVDSLFWKENDDLVDDDYLDSLWSSENDENENVYTPICSVEESKVTVLTEHDVAEIKRDFKTGFYNLSQIADRHHVSRRHAARIRDGEVWGWVKPAK